ncbi:tyrosine-type recombinase/integrase [Sphingobacterium deserti]|uniref:Site-specific tyrosine recombinase XerC n=1 Tax=Sphingobacterium deserti TaxID=1229276 RepID=A0A0B8TB26_9SPHI|nr:tyrosine-type recombinase/integrase [Sphingobacterium deserti]KGE16069.1 site-specific tyrosine recombinase XerC [Sphingobacterium deserti]
MHTYEISISFTDLTKRSFISITINGTRYREYNGNRINVNIKPNKAKTVKERSTLLKNLEYEFRKRLEDGSYQRLISTPQDQLENTETLMLKALNQKLSNKLNPHYAKALERNCHQFLNFLTAKEIQSDINHLNVNRIQSYLDAYKTSHNNYMAKRRELGSLLGYLKGKGYLRNDLLKQTDRLKVKASLHKIYSQHQLKSVLKHIKERNENLYLCCLLSYGCLLRPHMEIRNLTARHFKADCTEIHLSGEENKSGRVRVVLIPKYVRKAIYHRVKNLAKNENLFSNQTQPYNEYYFKTAWSRLYKEMLALDILEEKQTIYSFRHTAAVNVYKKSKDLHLLKQLLGHSDMIVTLKYLRGLGVTNVEELKNVMPEL